MPRGPSPCATRSRSTTCARTRCSARRWSSCGCRLCRSDAMFGRTPVALAAGSPAMSVNHVPAMLALAGVVFAQDSRPAPTKLEARVLAALVSEDPVLRAQAASLLGVTGDQRHVAAVGPLVDDGLPHVRTVAIG